MLDSIVKLTDAVWLHKMYNIIVVIIYVLLTIAFTGVATLNPIYLDTLESLVRYYVSILLLIRFNPWAKPRTDKESVHFDRRMAFVSGLFLFYTTALAQYLKSNITQIIKL